MRFFYSIIVYLLSPYLIIRLWWKGRRLPAYRQRIAERFCLDPMSPKSVDIWLHAVSLGEVIAAAPLIETLLQAQYQLLITTMTPTGSERVQALFGQRVLHRYLPYELPFALKRFFKAYKPRMGIIFETELWPNMIAYARLQGIPLFLFNGRLSEKSCRGYRKIRWFIKPLLNQFSRICVQSKGDAKRFLSLGADESCVHVYGNIKFDLLTQNLNSKAFADIAQLWGKGRTVLILASTHENEEAQLLGQLKKIQEAIPQVLVLIAPRHPERFSQVFQLSKEAGFKTARRSHPESIESSIEVLVIDSLGELLLAYQYSDYAFVGGSLVPVGGHNVLEPIAMGVPVFSGPHVHNFKTIIADLHQADAIISVAEAADFASSLIALHQDKERRTKQIQQASQLLNANKGSIGRYISLVDEKLGREC